MSILARPIIRLEPMFLPRKSLGQSIRSWTQDDLFASRRCNSHRPDPRCAPDQPQRQRVGLRAQPFLYSFLGPAQLKPRDSCGLHPVLHQGSRGMILHVLKGKERRQPLRHCFNGRRGGSARAYCPIRLGALHVPDLNPEARCFSLDVVCEDPEREQLGAAHHLLHYVAPVSPLGAARLIRIDDALDLDVLVVPEGHHSLRYTPAAKIPALITFEATFVTKLVRGLVKVGRAQRHVIDLQHRGSLREFEAVWDRQTWPFDLCEAKSRPARMHRG